MWLPNLGVSGVDEHASLLTRTHSLKSALLNINTAEKTPLSPIVSQSIVHRWRLLRHMCMRASVLMPDWASALCAYAYYARVFIACERRLQQSSS